MKKKIIVAPSILAADFLNLETELNRLVEGDIKWLHYDVMDGHFVPNISFGKEILKQIKRKYDFYYDVHIMVTNPEHAAKELIEAGADLITFHYEACENPKSTIETIKSLSEDISVGMSIKPYTSVDEIVQYLPYLDLVLVMSVEPGAGGQKFDIEALDKIEQLRSIIDEEGYDCLIEVDGGINDLTGSDSVMAGADILVAGTYIFKSFDVKEAVEKIYENLELEDDE